MGKQQTFSIPQLAGLFLSLLAAWIANPAYADVVNPTGQTLQSSTRVNRVEFDYIYTLTVHNTGAAVKNVVGTLTSSSPNTVVMDGAVVIATIGADSTTATDSFTIRQNRSNPFNPADLHWSFTSEPDGSNQPPTANAGADQTVYVGDNVILDGSTSSDVDGNALSFSWVLISVPADSTATLSGASSINPTFTTDKPGNYVVQLIVNDGSVNSTPDSVMITATASLPVITVAAQDANAAEEGSNVGVFHLSRTGSTATSLAVSFSISGTATNGTDYQTIGSATFVAGQSTTDVTVTPIVDTTIEGAETVVITLVDGVSYDLGAQADATVTIADSVITDPATEIEPNNTPAEAQLLNSIGSGYPVIARYEGNGTDDWYRFEATAGVTYVIELFNVATVLSNNYGAACTSAYYYGLYLVVQNNNGDEITRQCQPNGVANVENQTQFTAAASGTYYLKVAHHLATTTLTGAYSIRILPKHDNAAAAWDATHEPNNVAANAYQLQVGLSNAFTSTLEARSSVNYTVNADVDWYRFEATAGVTYVIELFNVATVLSNNYGAACTSAYYYGLYLVVQNNNGDEITRQCQPNGVANVENQTQFTAATGGTYYLKVAHHLATTTLTGAYSVRVTAE